jgi:hypothetical protein
VTTVFGPLTLTRASYHCARCDTGVCPRDAALGVDGTALSPAVTRMVGIVGARVSFVEGHALLHDLAGVEVDPKQVERTAEALGRAIAEDERTVVEAQPPTAPTMYLGMDGTGIPMRLAALAGRRGKQPDGTAKTREVKLCTVWTAEARDAEGRPRRDIGSVSYSAAIESAAATSGPAARASPFALRVDREAQRRGFDQAPRRVVLGDGAVWIWNVADEACPGAIQIVDLFHAKEHLASLATAIFGAPGDRATAWTHARYADLDAGHLRRLVRALRAHLPTTPTAAQDIHYFFRNRRRMRYPAFRAQGLCVSTGVVEAGCKTAIGARLKRSGMHWTLPGADAIIALRCGILSGRFEDFWERRAAHQRAA